MKQIDCLLECLLLVSRHSLVPAERGQTVHGRVNNGIPSLLLLKFQRVLPCGRFGQAGSKRERFFPPEWHGRSSCQSGSALVSEESVRSYDGPL